MDPFPALYEAFLRAAEAAPGLRKELFLEQARHHIAAGKLRALGRRFSVTFDRRGRQTFRVGLPAEPPDRVEIPPLAMADYRLIFVDGRKVDCQVVPGWWAKDATTFSACISGWNDVRGVAGDIEQLWPRTTETSPGAAAANGAERPISEHDMREMLQMAEANKEPGKVFGVRDAEALLNKTGRPYDRTMMRSIVKLSSGRGPGRPRK